MSGFKEECIDGCFFQATYSRKGGAYDLTAHYSLLMRRNDRVEASHSGSNLASNIAHPNFFSFF